MNSSRSIKGYTLIELLVAITISITVFSIGFVGYREFSRRQDLAGVKKNLLADLRLVQQLALTGQKPDGTTCAMLNGHTFTVTSTTSYQLVANCIDGNTVIKTVTFVSGVTMSATTASTRFKVLGHGTNLASDNTITLTNTYSGNTSTITIGTGGRIQ
jgi:prepilin-type N-terminal cleavage/methylation domain-containing protein